MVGGRGHRPNPSPDPCGCAVDRCRCSPGTTPASGPVCEVLPMNSRYSPKRPNGSLLDVGSLPSAVALRGAAGLQPGACRFCRAGGVHGELEAGASLGVRGIAALLGGGEALAENLRDATGGLRGGSDD